MVVIDGGEEIVPLSETMPGDGLSVRESKRLKELEEVVTRNFKAFYEVGCALREIQESRLYRATHTTFADYAQDLWDMARRTAYQYIEAAEIVDRLIPFEDELKNVRHGAHQESCLPKNERQARALAKYPTDEQPRIWMEAVETADGRITAAHIRRTARDMHGERVKKTIKKARERSAEPAVKMSPEFKAALDAFFSAIETERLKDWKETDPREAARFIEALLQAIRHPL